MNPQISATQISAFKCERRGGFKYWGKDFGVPKPEQGKGASLGAEVHALGEDYHNVGKYPDRLTLAGEMFIAGMPYGPPPKNGMAEGEFAINIGPISYQLLIDYRGPLPAKAKFLEVEEPVHRVILDYKTSSNPDKYGLWGREAFLNDPQAIIYAAYDLVASGDQEARLRWLYLHSKRRNWAKPSDAVLFRSEVNDAFGRLVHPRAVQISALKAAKPDPNSLEPNLEECNNYGGCPFRAHCKLSTTEALFGVRKKEITNMDMKSAVQARIAAQAAKKNGTPVTGEVPKPVDKINPPEAQAVAQAAVQERAEVVAEARKSVKPPQYAPIPLGDVPIRAERHMAPPVHASPVKVLCEELGKALLAAAARL